MKKLFFILFCLIITANLFAQNGIVHVNQFFLGLESSFIKSLQTKDGGYVAINRTYDFPSSSLLKFNSNLDTVWRIDLDQYYYQQYYQDVIQLEDSSYIICGSSLDQDFNIVISRISKNGILMWDSSYGGSGTEEVTSIVKLNNGNLLLLGYTNSTDWDILNKVTYDRDVLLLEISPSGLLINQKLFGGSNDENGVSLVKLSNGQGFAFAALTFSGDGMVSGYHGGGDFWVVRVDNNYNFLWGTCIGGTGFDEVYSLAQTSDSTLILTGNTISTDGDFTTLDGQLAGAYTKVHLSGNKIWSKTIGSDLTTVFFNKVIATGNGSFILSGVGGGFDVLPEISVEDGHGQGDCFVYKMNADGNTIWNRCIGGYDGEISYDIIKNNAGNYIISGTRFRDNNNDNGDFINLPYLPYIQTSFILELKELNTIKGYSYVDNNNNKLKDINEAYFTEGFVYTDKPGLSMQSVLVDGKFLFGVDTGRYSTSAYFKNTYPEYDSAQFRFVPKRVLSNIVGNSQTDSIVFRVVPLSFLDDVEITSYSPDTIPTGLSFPTTILFKNNLNKPVDSVKIKIQFNPDFSIISADPPPDYTIGDTSYWIKYNFGALEEGYINLVIKANSPPLFSDIGFKGMILPYESDYDTLNNRLTSKIFIDGQFSTIPYTTVDIKSSDSHPGKGEIIPYTIIYDFYSNLDTANGIIKLVKDHNTSLSAATPAPSSIIADTLIWNFSTLETEFNDTINLSLLVNENSNVQLGDTIKNIASIRFFTNDTIIVMRSDTIEQIINVICTPPNNVNTTLTAPQGIQWLRTLGGSDYDASISSAIVNDSSFVVAGLTYSGDGDFSPGTFDNDNAFVVKYSTNGTYLWKKIIGGNDFDAIEYIQKNADGSFIATGLTASDNGVYSTNHGLEDAWVLKLDSNGNVLWQKLFGGSNYDNGLIIKQTTDGGYIFLGNTESVDGDVITNPYPISIYHATSWAIKLNAAGNIVWQQFFADTMFTEANDVIETLDGGFMVAGAVPDGNNFYPFVIASIVKMDNNGNIVYCKKLNIPEHLSSYWSVLQNNDSSFVLTGTVNKSFGSDTTCIGVHGQIDILISKLDKNGNISYNKYFGGTENDWGVKIVKSNDAGYLVVGSTNSSDGYGNVSGLHESLPSNGYNEDDGWVLKLDSATNIVWQKTIGGNGVETIASVLQFPNNDIFVTGYGGSINNGDIFNYHGGEADVFVAKIGAANFIRGYVFVDQNSDGIKQPAEAYFTKGNVNSNKGPLVSASNISDGFYANSVDTGKYITKVIFNNSYYLASPLSDTTVFINYLQADSINFAMIPVPGIKDIAVTLIPLNIARPGFATQYQVQYENIGTTLINSGTVKFLRGDKTVFDSASVAPSNITADTISWNFTNFSPLESKTINVYLHLLPPPQNNYGDTLVLSVAINPVISDSTPLNNVSTINQLVSGSFDPNLKIETHGGILTEKQIADGEFLNYVIYFQNTGTDTAFRVFVRDTLSNKLDWQSFEMISASHPYQLNNKDSNKLEWKFDPIILPDSNHNEMMSHGFVAFRIKPKANNIAGNLINNKAAIYFDFNLPVETNDNITSVYPESYICPGANTSFASKYTGIHSYQWKVNSGSGYVNLNNSGIFSGVTSDTLKLTAIPSSYYGYKFHCIVDGNYLSPEYSLKFGTNWQGTVNTAWENPANWSCGVLPDLNTDAIINSGLSKYPDINANSGCRSIRLKTGATVLIKAGVQFILNGKK